MGNCGREKSWGKKMILELKNGKRVRGTVRGIDTDVERGTEKMRVVEEKQVRGIRERKRGKALGELGSNR